MLTAAAESPDGMLATHASIFHDELDTASYDMVRWADAAVGAVLPHVELSLRGHGRQHHRLGDRWGGAGSMPVGVPAESWTITARRDCSPDALGALTVAPGLAEIARLVDDRRGLRFDVVGEQCAVWVLTAGPRRGAERWRRLIDAAIVARATLADLRPAA